MRFLLIFCLIFLSAVACAGTETLKSGVFEPPRAAPDFLLPASTGGDFSLADARGKLVVLAFGFTHCPQICPMTLARLTDAARQLGDQASELQVLYISVDPERDSVARLQEYLAHFNPAFIGLTGTPEQLAEVRKAYGIMAAKEIYGDGSYQVHHSSFVYLIDRQGLLRALVPYGKSAEDISHDLAILLREPAEFVAP